MDDSSGNTSRRDFLTGRSAVAALENLAREAVPLSPVGQIGEPAADPYLVQIGRRAMACQFEVFVNAGQYPQATDGALAALDLVDALEDQLSAYRATSEVECLNRAAHESPIRVERRLFDLLKRSVELYRATQGAFDVTAGPLCKVWGFFRRAGQVPSLSELAAARESVGSNHLVLDDVEETLQFSRAGMELNLGAIGKGYALDRAAESLLDRGVNDFLWHAGQSSVYGRGSQAGADGCWRVGIRHPFRADRLLATVRLCDSALATSGAAHQFFRHQGRRFGHIIDPRTGWPAEGVISSSVVCKSAADADALSTAFYVLGPEAAQDYCRDHPEVGALLVVLDADSESARLVVAGLGDEDWILVNAL